MKILLHLIPEEGMKLEGNEPSSILDIQEPVYRFDNPIHYQLELNWVGGRNLLVQGSLQMVIRAQCVRSLEWFDLTVSIPDFKCHLADLQGDEVDLTEEIREDILIHLPVNPISPKAKPLEVTQPSKPPKGNEVWGKLDQLKLKKR